MLTGISAIAVFLVVILVHEFGHFSMAKLVGIKVNEFSIGMGPKIVQSNKNETTYTLRLLPIGGYVKMEGEDEASDDPRGFNKVSVGSRILVVIAGAVMNYILAVIIFSIIAFASGVPTTTIEKPILGRPAYESGILKDDKILEINGKSTRSWDSLVNAINKADTNQEMEVLLERGSETLTIFINPVIEEGRTIIGIEPKYEKSFTKSIYSGFSDTITFTKLMFEFFGMLFQGKVGLESLSGPVGVIHEVGQAARMGILNLLFLLGFININLGFFNLLPIPALDGSRVVFLVIELLRGKPVDPEKEGFVHFVGFVLLISLMLLVTYRDIIKFNIF